MIDGVHWRKQGVPARKFNWIAKNLLFHSNLMMNIVLLRYEY
jgi:hypothetical protein